MTSLAKRLKERITSEGPITFCEWMRAALYDEHDGYYRRNAARWGRRGDYRTSSESCSLFAATFARYFVSLHDELGRPGEFFIIETGGGSGDFARGVLQTIKRDAPETFNALRYIFDETSVDATSTARTNLAAFSQHVDFVPGAASQGCYETAIIFSNELLDSFPVHRLVMREGQWRELYVDIDRDNFSLVEGELSTSELAEYWPAARATPAEGQIIEVNVDAIEWVSRAAQSLKNGFIVTVDYGEEAERLYDAAERREGTLRSFSRHTFVEDFLQMPGESDLTTTVNWAQIRETGERAGLLTSSFERQDKFLLRVGLLEQLERESQFAGSEAETTRLRLDAREMILPGGMAEHFQVLVQRKCGS